MNVSLRALQGRGNLKEMMVKKKGTTDTCLRFPRADALGMTDKGNGIERPRAARMVCVPYERAGNVRRRM